MSRSRFALKIKPFIIALAAVAAVAVALALGLYFFIGHAVQSDGPTEALADKFSLGGQVTVGEIKADQGYKYDWIDGALVTVYAEKDGVFAESDEILAYDESARTFTVHGLGRGKLEFYNAVDPTVKFEFPYEIGCRKDTATILKSNHPEFFADGVVSRAELSSISELTINSGTVVNRFDVADFRICENLVRVYIPSDTVTVLDGLDSLSANVFVAPQAYTEYGAHERWQTDFYRVFPLVTRDPEQCTVVFEFDGGAMEGVKDGEERYFSALERGDSLDHADYPMSKTGYTFLGWTAGDSSVGTGEVVRSDIKLTAVWRENGYTVKYSSDHGLDVPPEKRVSYTQAFAAPDHPSEKTGYTFEGWATTADAFGAEFNAGDEITGLSAEDGATVTLYDVWKPNVYTVEFDGNGADQSAMPRGSRLTYDRSVTHSSMPTRLGYRFKGWAFDRSSDTPDFEPSTVFMNLTAVPNGVVTLYAVWQANKYTVEFVSKLDGATVPSPVTVEYDESFAMRSFDATREGYTFVGWTTESGSNSVEYRAGESTVNMTAVNGEKITLYDVWAVNEYTVEFDANGGSAAPENMAGVRYGEEITLPQALTRTGYTFRFWSTDSTGRDGRFTAGSKVKNLVTESGTVKLYAIWAVNEYDVWLDINDGLGQKSICIPRVSYEGTASVGNSGFTRTGYNLAGWSLDRYAVSPDYTTSVPIKEVAGEGDKIVLYAVWNGIEYTIHFDMSGADMSYRDLKMTYGQSVSHSVMPSRSGYVFKGWSLEKGSATVDYEPTTVYKDLTTEDGAVVTLYAVWQEVVYLLKYDTNGGSGAYQILHIPYNTNFVVTAAEPTRYGYVFKGWSLTRNGAVKYKPGVVTKNLTATDGASVTLYAVWEAATFTIKYDANGGNNPPAESRYLSYGSSSTAFTKTSPSWNQHDFIGWSLNKRTAAHATAADCDFFTGDSLTVEQVSKLYENSSGGSVTLYAVWDLKRYRINIESYGNGGGSVSISAGYYDFGSYVSFTVTYNATKNKGLYIDGTNVGSPSSYGFTMPNHDVTIRIQSTKKCFAAGTMIMLADGSSKKVEELTGEEKILSWDFETGRLIETPIILINTHGEDDYEVATLGFDDGTSVDIIAEHGFFDKTLGEFVYLHMDNVYKYVGHEFIKLDGGELTTVRLVGVTVEERHTTSYSVWAAKGLTCFAEGMLTVGPSGYMFGFGLFGITDMKYTEADVDAAVEQYGLYTYDDWKEYVTYEQYIAFNGKFLKIAEGMGLATKQEVIELIKRTIGKE